MATGKVGGSIYAQKPLTAQQIAQAQPKLEQPKPSFTSQARSKPAYPGEKPMGYGFNGPIYGKPDTSTGFDKKTGWTPAQQQQAARLRRQNLGGLASTARTVVDAATGYSPVENAIRSGNAASIAGALGVQAAGVLPFGRLSEGLFGVSRAVKAVEGVEAGVKAVRPFEYRPRTLTHGDLTTGLPKARSRMTNLGERVVDKASLMLQNSPHVANAPGVRLLTSGERVAKAAGRAQRFEKVRAAAQVAGHLNALKHLKPGSPEDVAHFWYAQLPAEYRNAKGLALVAGKQAQHLDYVTSGKALEDLTRREHAVNAQLHATRLGALTEPVAGNTIESGVIVHAADHSNYGRVVGVHGDTAEVHFVNRQEGTEATVKLPVEQLTSSGLRVKTGVPDAAAAASRDVFPLLQELEDIAKAKTDLPREAQDTAASVAQLGKLAENAPPVNPRLIEAAHALGDERQQILVDAGRLDPGKAAARKGLISQWLGVEPSGEEAYVGHRLAQPENSRFPFTPKGGTGYVASPKGMSENRLVIANNGRLRQSLHVTGEDWGSAQVFAQANQARHDLGALGTSFDGHISEGHVLVNPKGRTIPAHWKTDQLAQFHEGYEDIPDIRKQAEEIIHGFVADNPEAFENMKRQAVEQGVNWNELRVVPRRLVDRYYAQYRPLRARGGPTKAYDSLVDAVSTSIVFARIGYIPKNLVQNIIMAVPHQGVMLLPNAVAGAQAMADTELRHYILAEVGGTGATGSLGREMGPLKKVTGKITSTVSHGADDPIRVAAFIHELRGAGVISRVNPILTERDRAAMLRLFTEKSQRPLLDDIRSRSVEAMADFSRLTPDQARMARRFLIIPGWLMAGSRYPFHFALTHPVRSALLAYIAMGEPGAPPELQFNHPINEYFHGSGYKQGIDIGGERLRTNSLNPVTTPYDLAQALAGTLRGKTGPFDFTTPTVFDEVQPLLGAAVGAAQGEGIAKSAERLAPNYSLIHGLISPKESRNYPGDRTRLGRLKREVGILPIPINDAASAASNGKATKGSSYGQANRGGGSVYGQPSGGGGSAYGQP